MLWGGGGAVHMGGMKRRIFSFCVPPRHRYTIIALQISTDCCLEFTASAAIECFMGCLGGGRSSKGGGGG